MLEKISEVHVDNRFRENKKNSGKKYAKSAYQTEKQFDNDSLSLSPAFEIAARFHLKIKDITKSAIDKFEVKFELNDFLIDFTVDLKNLFGSNELAVKFSRAVHEDNNPREILFWFKYRLDKIEKDEDLMLSTDYLSRLLENVLDLSSVAELNIYDESSLNALIDGLEYGIDSEIYNLSSVTIKFIEKLFDQNITERLTPTNDEERSFTFQLVRQSRL
ncbi:MAG: hypothetical protein JW995_14960 [Melioribacteraceae bacterium]|nr:hypothetical protein [Melioribacteraceae bacterium]